MELANQSSIEESITKSEITITGRLVDASNATLFGSVPSLIDDSSISVIYKPIAGERPLWDFTEGNLASREVAAYQLSREMGLDFIPFTILREGPYGLGAVQKWIDIDEEFDLITFSQSQDSDLRWMALFDAVINNTDRKIGHLLKDSSGRLFGIDHGVSFHSENKLRTVLWQWRKMDFLQSEISALSNLLTNRTVIESRLQPLLSITEISALFGRISLLLQSGKFPEPSGEWPAIPWPPV